MTAVKYKAKGNSLRHGVWRKPQKSGWEAVRLGGCFLPFAPGQRYGQPWATSGDAPLCVGVMVLLRTLLAALMREEKNSVVVRTW